MSTIWPPCASGPSTPLTWRLDHVRPGHTAESLDPVLRGFLGRRVYKLLYLPFDEQQQVGARYCIVHFVDAGSAAAFLGEVIGRPWRVWDASAAADDMVEAAPAEVQGMGETIEEFMYFNDTGGGEDPRQLLVWEGGERLNVGNAWLMYPCGADDIWELVRRSFGDDEAQRRDDEAQRRDDEAQRRDDDPQVAPAPRSRTTSEDGHSTSASRDALAADAVHAEAGGLLLALSRYGVPDPDATSK